MKLESILLWTIPVVGGFLVLREVAKANTLTPSRPVRPPTPAPAPEPQKQVVSQGIWRDAQVGDVLWDIFTMPGQNGFFWHYQYSGGQRGVGGTVSSEPVTTTSDARLDLAESFEWGEGRPWGGW
jgi:hypothetical protein